MKIILKTIPNPLVDASHFHSFVNTAQSHALRALPESCSAQPSGFAGQPRMLPEFKIGAEKSALFFQNGAPGVLIADLSGKKCYRCQFDFERSLAGAGTF